jgi:hypothetical protein
VRAIQPFFVIAAMLCLIDSSRAAEFACLPDQCIARINEIVSKTTPKLVAVKQNCSEEGGALRCHYRNSSGPGINLITKSGSRNVQAIVIVDQRGLSPAGGVYIGVIMEAFDTSLNVEARKQFYNKLLGEFASNFQKGGLVQMNTSELKYVLSTDERFTIIGVSHAN